jgi:hypothetical protein
MKVRDLKDYLDQFDPDAPVDRPFLQTLYDVQKVWGQRETEDTATYKIVRHYKDKPSHIVHTGFTLEQAQEWCKREDTHGEGWFDGYTEEGR